MSTAIRVAGASRQRRAGIGLATPAALFFLIFWVVPFGYSVYLSFTSYDLASAPEWIGLDNYRRMLEAPQFWHSIRVTLVYVGGAVVPTMVLALLLAIPLSRPGRARAVLRSLIFIPAAIPLFAASMIWRVIYSTGGLADRIGEHTFGVQGWLTDPDVAMWSVLVMVIWKYLGLYVILFVAGLQALPQNVYEAAAIDGSRAVRTFFLVTLPQLKRTLLFVLVIAVTGAFNSFAPAYLLTQGGPARATEVFPLYLYNNAFSFSRMGFAAALALLLLVVLLALSIAQFRLIRDEEDR
ncbi:multiple sugar transport system permease protein [Kribbella antiqua]|uniref:Multiple sugar transport system permease protein n=1 Tax=Kribbella antiqua TaxID=2512217 RepID=A0A4R2J2G6_9ACTN|nr:sugar ABC transporter permease [Kribbella antiqua]TCO49505.1 multiple sugar transport system permease protein [Kribbella antiqua]